MASPITTHILDTARGAAAAGVPVVLERQSAKDDEFVWLAEGVTNADGRISDLLPDAYPLEPGIYRLTFQTGDYFAAIATAPAFYPRVRIEFRIPAATENGDDDARPHYHIPLLLSPFGYTTYRGT